MTTAICCVLRYDCPTARQNPVALEPHIEIRIIVDLQSLSEDPHDHEQLT